MKPMSLQEVACIALYFQDCRSFRWSLVAIKPADIEKVPISLVYTNSSNQILESGYSNDNGFIQYR